MPGINGAGADGSGEIRGAGSGARLDRHDESGYRVYSPADDNAARIIAYLGPYVFWVTVGVLSSVIFLIA